MVSDVAATHVLLHGKEDCAGAGIGANPAQGAREGH